MRVAGAGAGDIGVQLLQPMREAVGRQEIQRPVDGGRLLLLPLGRDPFEDVVGPHGLGRPEKRVEHPAAHRCELQSARGADGFGLRQRVGAAGCVIVLIEGAACHEGLI